VIATTDRTLVLLIGMLALKGWVAPGSAWGSRSDLRAEGAPGPPKRRECVGPEWARSERLRDLPRGSHRGLPPERERGG
jgi:hypothetical protein